MTMHAQEAISIRESLGLTPEELAADLGTTPQVVSAWESGRMAVSPRIAKDLRWRAAVLERHKALAESGLSVCGWEESWERQPVPDKLKDRAAHLERLVEHRKSCTTCLARDAFIAERFGPMPPRPMPAWMGLLSWISDRVEKWPEWTRPAAWVGLSFAAYSSFRIVLMVPAMLRDPQQVLVAALGLLASATLGAIIGLTYGGVRELWRRRARTAAT